MLPVINYTLRVIDFVSLSSDIESLVHSNRYSVDPRNIMWIESRAQTT